MVESELIFSQALRILFIHTKIICIVHMCHRGQDDCSFPGVTKGTR